MEGVREASAAALADSRQPIVKRLVLGRLDALGGGELVISDAYGQCTVGRPGPDQLRVRLTVHRDRLWRRVALGGLLAATEAYVDSDWDADDMTALARLFARNISSVTRLDAGLSRLSRPAAFLRYALSRNNRTGARRNISAHYDLGNEFFELMLDPTMAYSCGIFEREEATLEQASIAKMDRLCRKLALCPQDRLLEIGTGWGGLAIHAARHYGCQVTTATISRRQYEAATARVAAAGLGDRITVLFSDYRDLTGRFSKLVSVEMIEAVGAEYFETFFEACADRLEADGVMALQAITVADQRYEDARRATDFIKHYVFPGSCIPSVGALLGAASRRTDLRLVDLEDFTPHYARTLAEWRRNLDRAGERLERLTDERFRRLWHLYLTYCEGGFAERHTGLVQMVMARGEWRGQVSHSQPMTGTATC